MTSLSDMSTLQPRSDEGVLRLNVPPGKFVYTKHYVSSLFTSIQKMRKEMSTETDIILYENMREEYNYIVENLYIASCKRNRYYSDGAKPKNWTPKFVIIEC